MAAAPAVVLAVVLALRVDGPSLLWDGQGYLGAARWIARDDWPLLGELAFYHPAYGALLAPAVWLGASPMGLFRWAQAVNVLSIAACALAVGALARTLLPEGRTWVLATAAAVSYPALAVQAGFEWPEVPFAAVFALAALLAWRERWLGLAIAAVSLYALHPRGLGVVAVTAVLLLTRRAWSAVAVVVAGTLAVQLLNRAALDALYNPGGGSAAGTIADKLTEPGQWDDIVLKAVGHGWYLVAATLGLAVLALWSLARDRRPGAVWVAAAVLAVLAASALQLAGRGRADHADYGRYVEVVAPVLIVVAARHLRAASLAMALPAILALGLLTRWWNGADAFDGGVAFVNVPVLALLGEIDVVPATAAALAATLVLALLAWRTPTPALAAFAVAGLAAGSAAHALELDTFASDANRTYVLGPDVARFADGGVVAYDIAAYDALASNRYQWWAPGIDLAFWAHDEPPASTILARKGEPPVEGARVVAAEPRRDLALWVAPGPAQDELAARGWLVAEHTVPVDESFYEARAERVGDGEVRFTHAGGGAPWVPFGILPGDVGLVRVVVDGSSVALPDIVRPGESVVVAVPPGTTTVELEHVHHRTFGRTDVGR